jgi:phenylpropionate dioxygenase-like ring-hydroxylating dioxygenase large terminal subunit
VWVNMDPEAPPLAEWLGDVCEIIEPFEFESLRIAWHKTIIAPVNWKVVVEAFNEGYHSGATHSYWMDYDPMRAPGALHGRHGMYFTNFPVFPKAKKDNGVWSQIETMQEMIYYQSKELHETLFAMVTDPAMRAITRLRDETPPDMPPEQLFETLWNLQREELEKTGAKWPENLTLAASARAGTSWHIVPNTIFLPAPDGVLWYRMRPYGDDPKTCIFDIWGLQRYPAGQEPTVEDEVYQGFEAARGVNPFLEQDFDNMVAVDRGMRSRGWDGARTNPAEEILVVNLHRMIDEFLAKPPPPRS